MRNSFASPLKGGRCAPVRMALPWLAVWTGPLMSFQTLSGQGAAPLKRLHCSP
eukprot:CAMPEP_0115133352 /NCGR_PEP_ID=MMETSP0227-20121206/54377_1 /TAXON_ID=89957 /ORGANISM="Polarella glacialis, Strain CCMP 1383" /LENGTH=52 /DNA_ID=CAMNT_0002539479 /DNA_START=30 /DNA_END=185 /DNA_ORIENTATION=+